MVSGCGGVGMSALMAARLCGCDPIVAVDVVDSRLELALELDLPVIVHDREAHGDCLEIVREFPGVRGVFHCCLLYTSRCV